MITLSNYLTGRIICRTKLDSKNFMIFFTNYEGSLYIFYIALFKTSTFCSVNIIKIRNFIETKEKILRYKKYKT